MAEGRRTTAGSDTEKAERRREQKRLASERYRKNHPERVAATRRAYYENNTEKAKASSAKWRAENPEKVKQQQDAYCAENREKRLAYKREYDARPETRAKRSAYMKNLYDTDPNYRLASVLRCRLRLAMKSEAKVGSAVTLLGCTTAGAWDHLESLFTEGMTRENYGEWHIDHIRPLSAFDLTDPDQLAEACHYTNLQPLWAADNLRKWAHK